MMFALYFSMISFCCADHYHVGIIRFDYDKPWKYFLQTDRQELELVWWAMVDKKFRKELKDAADKQFRKELDDDAGMSYKISPESFLAKKLLEHSRIVGRVKSHTGIKVIIKGRFPQNESRIFYNAIVVNEIYPYNRRTCEMFGIEKK